MVFCVLSNAHISRDYGFCRQETMFTTLVFVEKRHRSMVIFCMVAQIPMIKKACAYILNILNTQCSNGQNLDSLLCWNHSSKCLVDSNVCSLFNAHTRWNGGTCCEKYEIRKRQFMFIFTHSSHMHRSIRHSSDTTFNCSSTCNWLMNFKQILLPCLWVTIKGPWLFAWTKIITHSIIILHPVASVIDNFIDDHT